MTPQAYLQLIIYSKLATNLLADFIFPYRMCFYLRANYFMLRRNGRISLGERTGSCSQKTYLVELFNISDIHLRNRRFMLRAKHCYETFYNSQLHGCIIQGHNAEQLSPTLWSMELPTSPLIVVASCFVFNSVIMSKQINSPLS
jgi:hypothetical protein